MSRKASPGQLVVEVWKTHNCPRNCPAAHAISYYITTHHCKTSGPRLSLYISAYCTELSSALGQQLKQTLGITSNNSFNRYKPSTQGSCLWNSSYPVEDGDILRAQLLYRVSISWPANIVCWIRHSLLKESPIQIIVGSSESLYYVHPGALSPFKSSALSARVNEPLSGQEKVIKLSGNGDDNEDRTNMASISIYLADLAYSHCCCSIDTTCWSKITSLRCRWPKSWTTLNSLEPLSLSRFTSRN